MNKFFDPNGKHLFSAKIKTNEDILKNLKTNNLIKNTKNIIIEKNPLGITEVTKNGTQEICTIQ